MRALTCFFISILASSSAHAESAYADLSDEEVTDRLRFLEGRLKHEGRAARAWSYGWLAVYTAGAGVQAGRAAMASDESARIEYLVGAASALVGVTGRVARPLLTMRGASELRADAELDADDRRRKLFHAESLLLRNAHEADRRKHWLGHVLAIGLNVAGAAIIWGVNDDPKQAAISFGIGIALGEISIWSQPQTARHDLRDYRRRVSVAANGTVRF